MSGRFVNPEAVDRLSLGACQCVDKPHDTDWIDLRTELSGSDWYDIARGDTASTLALIAKEWNLVDESGPVPLDPDHLRSLDLGTFQKIDGWVESHLVVPSLPNASAAPSRGSSRGSGSRTRTAQKGNSSTTPSWQAAGVSETSGTPAPTS